MVRKGQDYDVQGIPLSVGDRVEIVDSGIIYPIEGWSRNYDPWYDRGIIQPNTTFTIIAKRPGAEMALISDNKTGYRYLIKVKALSKIENNDDEEVEEEVEEIDILSLFD
jgi:hypothetical protein